MTPSIQISGNIISIHIRTGCTFQYGNFVLGGYLIRVFGKQIIPWSYCVGSFHLSLNNYRWNNFHVTCPRAVSWILYIVVVMERLRRICKYPHADGYPEDWRCWSTDNTHHLVLLLKLMPLYFSIVNIYERT